MTENIEQTRTPKAGDVVIVNWGGAFFNEGNTATLRHKDGDEDWWGDFNGHDNLDHIIAPNGTAVWCIGKYDDDSFTFKEA